MLFNTRSHRNLRLIRIECKKRILNVSGEKIHLRLFQQENITFTFPKAR